MPAATILPSPPPATATAAGAPRTSTAPAAAPGYTIAVRALCEFTAKEGDLDLRFTPAATALEAALAQPI